MGCDNCPKSATNRWVVYTGGPPHLVFRLLQQTLPPEYTRAAFQKDGSLLYTEGEPPVCPDGYVRDETNQFLFHPVWEPCVWRSHSTGITPCGSVQVLIICSHYETETTQHTFNDCKGCPHRQDLSG